MPSPFIGTFDIVPHIYCVNAKGSRGHGSSVRISDDLIITARHVLQDEDTGEWRQCTVNGKPVKVLYNEPGRDFSVAKVESMGLGYRAQLDCNGFKAGRDYLAIGYTKVVDTGVIQSLVGTNQYKDRIGQSILIGLVYYGMSGGAIVDLETGALVGITAQKDTDRPWAWSVPISETYLCRT